MSGLIQYVGGSSGNLTANKEYPIVALAPSGAVMFVDDSGAFYTVTMPDVNFTITELFVPVRVI